MERSYAIGDIHGHLDKLRAAHDRIAADRARCGDAAAPVIHLGDLTDRGPESRGVIDYLIEGIARGEPWLVIRGNHDETFLQFVLDPARPNPVLPEDETWLSKAWGGSETLRSYGVTVPRLGWSRLDLPALHRAAHEAVPQAHVDFLRARPYWHRRGDCVFVHAGVRRGVAIEDQDPNELIWLREPFLSDPEPFPWLVVHGHTVVGDDPVHFGNRLALDTGAPFGGPLTAAVIEGREAWRLTDQGREVIAPPERNGPRFSR
ncbi:metallophosphoesterase [Pseudoroseicyclus aestuarii]|uniref:Serine/threonine protein phosphatase 1 n=1 Tax=Pseudoroseicyclus aestuarii TaxID=1795041 RepID=A0A318SVS2_9RHOB|nr:metallophosphoesterase [Pseudoroseicyclus aestuarii]PYE85950.1 serine/threonine protein phosphatase 1 [Pseudoroseicyclus aestuarii]